MIEKYNPQLIPLKPLYNDKTFYQFDIKKRWGNPNQRRNLDYTRKAHQNNHDQRRAKSQP